MSEFEHEMVMKVCDMSRQHKVEFSFVRLHRGGREEWACNIADQLGNLIAGGEGLDRNAAFDDAVAKFDPNAAMKTPQQAAAEIAMLKEQLAAAESKPAKKS